MCFVVLQVVAETAEWWSEKAEWWLGPITADQCRQNIVCMCLFLCTRCLGSGVR